MAVEATGERYSAATIITRDNVRLLAQAWTFHTGDQPHASGHGASFEDTPILADGKLLVCTPSDRVVALDPLTGQQEWAFDPKLSAGLKLCQRFRLPRRRGSGMIPSAAPDAALPRTRDPGDAGRAGDRTRPRDGPPLRRVRRPGHGDACGRVAAALPRRTYCSIRRRRC